MTYLDHADIRFTNGEVMRIGPNFISEVNVAGAKEDMCWVNNGDAAEKDAAREFTCDNLTFVFAPAFYNSTFAESNVDVKTNAVLRIEGGKDVESVILYGKKAGKYVFKVSKKILTATDLEDGRFRIDFVGAK